MWCIENTNVINSLCPMVGGEWVQHVSSDQVKVVGCGGHLRELRASPAASPSWHQTPKLGHPGFLGGGTGIS